ncbi:hypothetical protein YC2023_025135 [Brassica napus]
MGFLINEFIIFQESQVKEEYLENTLARATCPERRTEVARISHPSRSDLPKRHPEVARVSMARRHEAKPGATSQSDLPRSLPIQSDPLERHTKVARDLSPGHTKNRPWSDFPERHLQVAPRYFAAENHDFLRTFLQFILDSNHNASSELATQLLILRHFSPESDWNHDHANHGFFFLEASSIPVEELNGEIYTILKGGYKPWRGCLHRIEKSTNQRVRNCHGDISHGEDVHIG